jgi:DNA-binding MarR family transcriptional regulator
MSHLRRDQSLGYLVNHLARLMARTLHAEISTHGVVPGQFPVLLSLWEEDGLTQTELHQRTQVEQATMANTLQRMERDGLIERQPDPADARRARVHLTPRARALEDVLVSSARRVNAIATRTMPAADRVHLLALLRTVIAALESERRRAAEATVAARVKPGRAPARRVPPHDRRG